MLSVADLPGNPYVNFLIQSLVEFPAFICGQRLCEYASAMLHRLHYRINGFYPSHPVHLLGNTIGRRLANSLAFAVAAVLSLGLVYTISCNAFARTVHKLSDITQL